jgi:peptidyl-prolyl cis-trans isomerase C
MDRQRHGGTPTRSARRAVAILPVKATEDGEGDTKQRRTDIPVCRRGLGVERAGADAARVLDRQECLSSCVSANRHSRKSATPKSFWLVRAHEVCWLALALLFAAMLFHISFAAEAPKAASTGEDVVVATVGEEPILAGEVSRRVAALTQGQSVNPAARPVLEAVALGDIVDRRLVLAYARRTGSFPEPAEIDAALARLKTKLAAQGQSMAGHLKAQSLDAAGLQREIAFDLVWQKYLAKYITTERSEAYFQSHRREFDGTQIAVSHILLRPAKGSDAQAAANLVKQAAELREAIAAGKTAFDDAARRHSSGPSGKDGGRLGFIPRRGVMDEAFSRAAFALEPGQVSQPVQSRFGVHLIRCDQVKPGTTPLSAVRTEVEEALARELLTRLAQIESRHTPVRFHSAGLHFNPGTTDPAPQ